MKTNKHELEMRVTFQSLSHFFKPIRENSCPFVVKNYLGTWERISNPSFKSLEFGEIENDASVNRFIMSAGQWKALL